MPPPERGIATCFNAFSLVGMRRLTFAFVIVLMALPALALASHTDPKRQINAVDQRKATSILLKRTDFNTGWTKLPNSPDDDEHMSCPGYNPDESDLVLTGDSENSFRYSDRLHTVFSMANVYKTRANALASWTRGVKPAAPACFAKLMKQIIEEDGTAATIVRKGWFAFPKLAPRTAAMRIVLNVTFTNEGQKTLLPLTITVVGVGNGRGDASLMTMAFGTDFAMSDLRGFAKLLAQRLAAAKL